MTAEQINRKELLEELSCQVNKSEYLESVVTDSGKAVKKLRIPMCDFRTAFEIHLNISSFEILSGCFLIIIISLILIT